jgi:hypothetical protein
MGAFNVTAQTVKGDFVSFSYGEAGVQAFLVDGTRVFDIQATGTAPPGNRTGAQAHGAEVHVRTAAYDLMVHDNPEAVTRIVTNGTVTLTLAPGANVTLSAGGEQANFTLGGLSGRVRGDALQLAGNALVSRNVMLVFVDAPHGAFDVHREAIGEAAARGHVGIEASFNKGRGDDGVEQDIVSYGNVTMRTLHAARGDLTVQVEGHGTEGRVLVLNVDGALLGASDASRLRIALDNRAVRTEENLSALLDPDADGVEPVSHVVFDPDTNAFQLLVRVPHYSVHTLSVTTILEEASPSIILGLAGAVVVLAASAGWLFRPRRE